MALGQSSIRRFRISATLLLAVVLTITVGGVSPAFAQESDAGDDDGKSPWRSFDSMTVERIRPADLPAPEESKFPTVLKSQNVLPKAASVKGLQKTARKIRPLVVEIVALHRPKPPLRQTPMILRGHGVWVSAEEAGKNPVLVTTWHWVEGAAAVYAVPAEVMEDAIPEAKRRSLDSVTVGGLDVEALLAHKDELVSIRPIQPDEHRNLVALAAAKGHRLPTPDAGLMFFDVEGQSPTRVYGYSPSAGTELIETAFIDTPADEPEFSFYLQTAFGAILGAPLVSSDGRIIGLTAMRHPQEPERVLVIPPLALQTFIEAVQGSEEAELTEEVESSDEEKPSGDGSAR